MIKPRILDTGSIKNQKKLTWRSANVAPLQFEWLISELYSGRTKPYIEKKSLACGAVPYFGSSIKAEAFWKYRIRLEEESMKDSVILESWIELAILRARVWKCEIELKEQPTLRMVFSQFSHHA